MRPITLSTCTVGSSSTSALCLRRRLRQSPCQCRFLRATSWRCRRSRAIHLWTISGIRRRLTCRRAEIHLPINPLMLPRKLRRVILRLLRRPEEARQCSPLHHHIHRRHSGEPLPHITNQVSSTYHCNF